MLTTLPPNELLDLPPWVGQRTATFKFVWINGATDQILGEINPIRDAVLSHETARIIKRQLTMNLGAQDVAAINAITDRILLYMILGDGSVWPLGRYMFTDQTKTQFTSGELSNVVLSDEMFLIDQPIIVGYDGTGKVPTTIYQDLLEDFTLTLNLQSAGFAMSQSWTVGTNRGSILNDVALAGDYFSPWLGNDGALHLIRTFNPANEVPQFDWDAGNQVLRAGIIESSNILIAPNRFMVISNTSAESGPVVGIATVPVTAPNSFANRGFYITKTETLQMSNGDQAQAVATGLANRQTIFETVRLSTAPDPRHDSYDVIHWNGSLWLELSWEMNLLAGGAMTHVLRKGYLGA